MNKFGNGLSKLWKSIYIMKMKCDTLAQAQQTEDAQMFVVKLV